MSVMTPEEILDFVRPHLLDYELHGVLQVGSSARGYAIDNSDVDLMAFYGSGGELVSRPSHLARRGVNVTLEHHDLHGFILDTLDHRFSLASLRQIHKVRDGIKIHADHHLDTLLTIARLAYLDEAALLRALHDAAVGWPAVLETNRGHARHLLIKSAELLATLDVMTRPGTAAYSKPKWLYTVLKQAGLREALGLLDMLYVPTPERSDRMRGALEAIIASHDARTLEPRFHKLFDTSVKDVRSMWARLPDEAAPQMRFLALLYYQLFYGGDPLEKLKRSEEFEDKNFGALFEPDLPAPYDHQEAVAAFLRYARTLARRVNRKLAAERESQIGTKRLMVRILSAYDAKDLLPGAAGQLDAKVNEWLRES